MGVLVYNPLAGGMLSGKYTEGQALVEGTRFTLGTAASTYQRRYWDDATIAAASAFAQACRERDIEPTSAAVAWVLRQPGVTSAIIGASRVDQLAANLKGAEVTLDDALVQLCNALFWTLPNRAVVEGYT
jgi:aryl-alcohol dehydrogenase-like predicted oxidoreductase